ncbi:hypothetical protein DAI22_05g191000 [Oryza sativa Japonica Group]|nr:hypothetical protein DAI22_05g191000 [Oryza sativa Japonica Group]
MFHPSSSSSPPTYSDSSMHHALSFSSALPTAPTEIPGSGGGFVDDKGSMFSLPNVAGSAPPPSYYSSLPSFYIHRSTSSHSLLHHRLSDLLNSNAAFSYSSAPACQLQPLPPVSSSTSSSSGDLLEFSSGTLRRVFSTGDLQAMNVPPSPPPPPPFSGDICIQEVGGPFSQKVGRYSAEERKERIESMPAGRRWQIAGQGCRAASRGTPKPRPMPRPMRWPAWTPRCTAMAMDTAPTAASPTVSAAIATTTRARASGGERQLARPIGSTSSRSSSLVSTSPSTATTRTTSCAVGQHR